MAKRSVAQAQESLDDLDDLLNGEEGRSGEEALIQQSVPLVPMEDDDDVVYRVRVIRSGNFLLDILPEHDLSIVQKFFGGGMYKFIAMSQSNRMLKHSKQQEIVAKVLSPKQLAARIELYKQQYMNSEVLEDEPGEGGTALSVEERQELALVDVETEVKRQNLLDDAEERRRKKFETEEDRRIAREERQFRRDMMLRRLDIAETERRLKLEIDKAKEEGKQALERERFLAEERRKSEMTMFTFMQKMQNDANTAMMQLVQKQNENKGSFTKELAEMMSVAKMLGFQKDNGSSWLDAIKEFAPSLPAVFDTVKTAIQTKAELSKGEVDTTTTTTPAIEKKANPGTIDDELVQLFIDVGATQEQAIQQAGMIPSDKRQDAINDLKFSKEIKKFSDKLYSFFDKKIAPEKVVAWIDNSVDIGEYSLEFIEKVISLDENYLHKFIHTVYNQNEEFYAWYRSILGDLESEVSPQSDAPRSEGNDTGSPKS